jgi:hypothetical protein
LFFFGGGGSGMKIHVLYKSVNHGHFT